jgi:hypothetical protein
MKKVIKLSQFSWDGVESSVLIGIESIIDAKEVVLKRSDSKTQAAVTKIQSRGAMVETNYVLESVNQIFNLINQ